MDQGLPAEVFQRASQLCVGKASHLVDVKTDVENQLRGNAVGGPPRESGLMESGGAASAIQAVADAARSKMTKGRPAFSPAFRPTPSAAGAPMESAPALSLFEYRISSKPVPAFRSEALNSAAMPTALCVAGGRLTDTRGNGVGVAIGPQSLQPAMRGD